MAMRALKFKPDSGGATAKLVLMRGVHINFWQQKTHKNNFRELMHSPCSRKWAFAICASQGPLDLLLDGEGNAD